MAFPKTQSTAGAAAITFGVSGLTGYIVQEFGRDHESKVATVQDEEDNDVHRRYYDDKKSLQFDAIIKDGTSLPEPGDDFTYDGTAYEVQKLAEKGKKDGFLACTITAIRTGSITPA